MNTYTFSALYVVITVLDASPSMHISPATHDHLTAAGLFTTLAVTLWTTILISYRIYSASNHILNRKKRHFYNILEIVIQSSFIYSLALVVNALLLTMPQSSSIFTASSYIACFVAALTVC